MISYKPSSFKHWQRKYETVINRWILSFMLIFINNSMGMSPVCAWNTLRLPRLAWWHVICEFQAEANEIFEHRLCCLWATRWGWRYFWSQEHRTWQQIERGLCVTSQKKRVREYSGGRLRDVREASFEVMPLNTSRPSSSLFLLIHWISSDFIRHYIGIF
jgi:hypothetical protein